MAKRVGYRCSNPSCKKPTCGASDDPNNYSNIDVAAHICSAARGGKRYNPDMSKEERRDIHNVKQEQSCFKLLLLQYQTLSCVLMDGFPKTTAGSGSRYNSGSVIRKTQKNIPFLPLRRSFCVSGSFSTLKLK